MGATTSFAESAMEVPTSQIEKFAYRCVAYKKIELGTEVKFAVNWEDETSFHVGVEWPTKDLFGEMITAEDACPFSKINGEVVFGIATIGLDDATNIGTLVWKEDLGKTLKIKSAIRTLEKAGYLIEEKGLGESITIKSAIRRLEKAGYLIGEKGLGESLTIKSAIRRLEKVGYLVLSP